MLLPSSSDLNEAFFLPEELFFIFEPLSVNSRDG